MEQPSAGINYYHTVKDEFYSSESTKNGRNYMRLNVELLVEHEDRYRARAKSLLKSHVLQMNFKDMQVEYYIASRMAHFSLRGVNDNSFQDLIALALPRRKKYKIAALIELFAQSEAMLILDR